MHQSAPRTSAAALAVGGTIAGRGQVAGWASAGRSRVRVFHDGARQGVLRAMSKIEIKTILGMYFHSFLWIKGDGAMTMPVRCSWR